MKEPFVSIQILNYNGKKFLKGCIDSLLKQNYSNYEILLVDNASSDGSIEFVEKNYKKYLKNKKIRLLVFEKNYGVSGGYAKAYDATNSDYVLILNNDTIADKRLVSILVKEAIKKKAALTCGWEYPVDIKKVNSRVMSQLNYPALTVLGFCIPDVLEINTPSIAGGGCCLINKKKINFSIFPEKFFAYGEDVYLGLRAFLRGEKIIFIKEAIYMHYGCGTTIKGSYFIRFNSEKNRLANLLIFYEPKTLIKIFPLYAIKFILKTIYYPKDPKHFKAIMNSFPWVIKNLKWILKERRKIQNERTISDKILLKTMTSKIFPQNFSPRLGNVLNRISKTYCSIVGLNTYN